MLDKGLTENIIVLRSYEGLHLVKSGSLRYLIENNILGHNLDSYTFVIFDSLILSHKQYNYLLEKLNYNLDSLENSIDILTLKNMLVSIKRIK